MEPTEHIAIHAAPHPVPQVQRAGFPLDHPYLDHCWAPVLGPSGTLLLRLLPWLWKQSAPVEIAIVDLSRSLGLGAGTGRNSPARRTIDRLVGFRLASWRGLVSSTRTWPSRVPLASQWEETSPGLVRHGLPAGVPVSRRHPGASRWEEISPG